jgi:hypothetical protein
VVGQILARKAGLRAGDRPIFHPKFPRRGLAAHLDEVGGPNNVLIKDWNLVAKGDTWKKDKIAPAISQVFAWHDPFLAMSANRL